MQGARRLARNFAVQFLYQLDVNPDFSDEAVERFWRAGQASRRTRDFAMTLVRRTWEERPRIDAELAEALEGWKLGRLPTVVRSILRLAYCEMLLIGDVPPVVVIDEAVALTHHFMDEASAKFVNSVLEKCRSRQAEAPEQHAAP